ncbi:unnamed protein product [Brassica oleracea var. botrytis]|uniref:SHOOT MERISTEMLESS n=3 Tax=Brassica TaxID=3705 RepID=A0A8X7UFZ4_BRACI|nr:hypothetical protein Bca52824_059862 [Brassica carinata]CAF1722962.1 unnamed protein product [Brassica napus]CDY19545.1 BnaC09g13580D [Brassica napus]VDD29564.1 unnamed protein product [Brassica oleracea]
MESGSNSTSCPMAFAGDNSDGPMCPMMMMMMPVITSHQQHHGHDQQHQHQQQHDGYAYQSHHQHSSLLFLQSLTPPSQEAKNKVRSSCSPSSGAPAYSFMEINHQNELLAGGLNPCSSASVKAKIMGHPHYHRLLLAYVNCQKVGAPPEVQARLEETCSSAAAAAASMGPTGSLGEDPGLDQFMEAYCEMLVKYEQELSKPFKEAMVFLQHVECQFKSLSLSSPSSFSVGYGEAAIERNNNGSSEEEVDMNNEFVDPQAEDRELKGQLLRKYSGYLGSLKQEFMKKRKKGKLPKEARQQLLDWWSRHYKWPYPSEQQKLALAESTGLDQKQINNWFINQRKRHWKPSEDMQFVVMDATHPHHYFMDNVMGNPFPIDHISSTML